MTLVNIFIINQNIIEIHYNKSIKFFCQDFTDKAIKTSENVKKNKKYNLILKMTVLCLETGFLLITLPNSFLMI